MRALIAGITALQREQRRQSAEQATASGTIEPQAQPTESDLSAHPPTQSFFFDKPVADRTVSTTGAHRPRPGASNNGGPGRCRGRATLDLYIGQSKTIYELARVFFSERQDRSSQSSIVYKSSSLKTQRAPKKPDMDI